MFLLTLYQYKDVSSKESCLNKASSLEKVEGEVTISCFTRRLPMRDKSEPKCFFETSVTIRYLS